MDLVLKIRYINNEYYIDNIMINEYDKINKCKYGIRGGNMHGPEGRIPG